jgi:hypothetical protein
MLVDDSKGAGFVAILGDCHNQANFSLTPSLDNHGGFPGHTGHSRIVNVTCVSDYDKSNFMWCRVTWIDCLCRLGGRFQLCWSMVCGRAHTNQIESHSAGVFETIAV